MTPRKGAAKEAAKKATKRAVFSKDFTLVVIGQIVSVFGNQILRYALPLHLLNQTGSPALFGTILAASFIPMILLFPIGGILADRVNKRNIMVILDFGTTALIGLFYLLVGRMALVPLMAITMMVLYGIQGAYQPAVKASVPVLVGTEHIMKANSVVDVVNSAASMAGPVIGGLVFSVLGLMPILYICIGCFFASAVMEVFIHIPFEKRKATGNIVVTGFGDLKESFRFMFREQPALWKVSVIFGSSNLLLTALVMVGIPVIITGHLGFAPDTANRLYGYAQGVIAAGAVAGGLLAGVLSNRLRPRSGFVLLLGCSLSVIIGGVALQTVSTPLGVYLVLLVGCGLLLMLHTLFQIQMLTVLQFLTPIDLIGKVVSVFICIVMATSPLGQLLYGFVFENAGSGSGSSSSSGGGGGGLYLPFYAAGLVMIIISVLTRRVFSEIDRQIQELAGVTPPRHSEPRAKPRVPLSFRAEGASAPAVEESLAAKQPTDPVGR